jgi:hypothetical protein
MASIEYITKRIEGKQKEITKLENKLSRIEKAKATKWQVNPYYYHEDDLRWTLKDLETARKALADWEAQLVEETEKANSRNVPAILEFLEAWKSKVMNYYERMFPEYLKAKETRIEEHSEYCDNLNRVWHEREKREEVRKAEKELERQFNQAWGNFIKYDDFDRFDKERLQKELNRDAELKYDDIIERTNFICGTITDATGLRVGLKGDLDGFIIGERGTAKVQTIGAGGYNIQCFHFRTLVHEVK